jgi:hypothetical protein
MRVSQHYRLKRTQAELDFVDVDVRGDTRLFLDPQAIRRLPGTWGPECVAYVQDYFTTVLAAISKGRDARARALLQGLREPNETHLGFSQGKARGRALGPESARSVWQALSTSQAARSGLLVHLEDTILLVPGIGPDIVSDITTNLIRLPLVKYTQDMCDQYGISMDSDVWTGPLWNPGTKSWEEGELVPLPTTKNGRLLLTPKAIVRRRMAYDATEYYGDFIIPFLEQEEIRAGTSLVRVLKKKRTKYVTNTDLEKKYGADKKAIVRLTIQNPQLLSQYKRQKAQSPKGVLSDADLAAATGSALPDYDSLLQNVLKVQRGKKDADNYHAAVERLVSALFSTSLTLPNKEYPIHDGRKRIDIIYVNAGGGFFGWVQANYPAANVIVECKNYTGDPANPELDQLSGRFSVSRGQFGLLLCRSFKNKRRFLNRCRDTAKDLRGYIVPLDDDDLAKLTKMHEAGDQTGEYKFLMDRFQYLLT